MIEAILYKKLAGDKVQCRCCSHFCLIAPDNFGQCRVRQNQNGRLKSLNYGKVIAEHLDPIEKKPLAHYLPRTLTYSLACAGCNFSCLNCQNYDISQADGNLLKINNNLKETKPAEIIKRALQARCPSISYTYTEPTIFAEFALDCMRLAKEKNLKNIWVSNGFMSQDLLKLIIPYLDAINVDLKFFTEKNYQQICGGRLAPVLANLIRLKNHGVHLEITTLIIPALNDSETELKNIAEFICQKLGAETPWHISACQPAYRLTEFPATAKKSIQQAQKIGISGGLKYVYPTL